MYIYIYMFCMLPYLYVTIFVCYHTGVAVGYGVYTLPYWGCSRIWCLYILYHTGI